MTRYYRLANKQPIPCTQRQWQMAFEIADVTKYQFGVTVHPWVVCQTDFSDRFPGGVVRITTAFVGADDEPEDAPPRPFETMVLCDRWPAAVQLGRRYSWWDEADAGHAEVSIAVHNLIAAAEGRIVEELPNGLLVIADAKGDS